MDPSEGGAAVDVEGVSESSSSIPSKERRWDEIELSMCSIVTSREDGVSCLFSYTREFHINNQFWVASRAELM
jgi:hypothetical protein